MAEKRKPEFVMLLKKEGKTKSNKIEFFNADLWGYQKRPRERLDRYRLRVNGKWYGKKGYKVFLSKWEARDILFRSILN